MPLLAVVLGARLVLMPVPVVDKEGDDGRYTTRNSGIAVDADA